MIKNNRYYWSHLKTKNVTVRVVPKKKPKGVVFRVKNMIDLGQGRQTVMLEHVDYSCEQMQRCDRSKDVPVPFRMGGFDFVYTSGIKPAIRNVQTLLSTIYKNETVEKITVDVLSPGDLLVFKEDGNSGAIKMVDALRVIKDYTCYKKTANYAL